MGLGTLVSATVMIGLALVIALVTLVLTPRNDRDALGTRIVGTVSLGVAAIVAVGTIWQAITMLIPGSSIEITVPVQSEAITVREGISVETAAHLDHGAYTQADVTSSTLSAAVRIPGAIGGILVGVVPVLIGITIWIVCRRLLAGAPFAASVSRVSVGAALVSLIAGLIGQVLLGAAASTAAEEIFFVTAAAFPGESPDVATGLPVPTMLINLNFWPVTVAFVLIVFNTIVQFGARVQDQRDALEVESAALRRDTDGLV